MIIEDLYVFIEVVTKREFKCAVEKRNAFSEVEFTTWHYAPLLEPEARRKLLGRLNMTAARLFKRRSEQAHVFCGHVHRETCRILMDDSPGIIYRSEKVSHAVRGHDQALAPPTMTGSTMGDLIHHVMRSGQ